MSLKLITGPTLEPITVEQAVAYCKAPADAEAVLFDLWIRGARGQVEEHLGRALLSQTWELALDEFPADQAPIDLPRPPLISVTSLTTYSPANVSAVCSSAVYQVDTWAEPGRLVLVSGQSWPTDLRDAASVVVRYVAGYGTTREAVPAPIAEALLALVAQRWANRGDVPGGEALPRDVAERLAPYRQVTVA